jgi:hypothetical protein
MLHHHIETVTNKIASVALILCIAASFSTAGFGQTASNLSGSWKVDSRAVIPICGLHQIGNNITGACTGPQATGTVTGSIAGERVSWRWQRTVYANSWIAAYDFAGTLQPDGTITGTIECQEVGLSVNFTAKRQAPSQAIGQQNLPNRPSTASAGSSIPGSTSAAAVPPQPSDQELEQTSLRIFNPAGLYAISADQEAKRQQWLYNAKQQKIRNQIEIMRAGHDYTVERRN